MFNTQLSDLPFHSLLRGLGFTGEMPTGILGFQSSGLTLLHSSLLGCTGREGGVLISGAGPMAEAAVKLRSLSSW